jgi:RNA polymerase sigma-32 factor
MAVQTVNLSATSDANLTKYLQEIRKFPMLAPDEEAALARRWRDHEDHEAAHRLVNSHLRLVVKIAMGFRGYGLPVSDLISEGNFGVLQAVKRFDPERGFRFATYAIWWIRASIQEYILHSWSLVKIGTTAAQKKLFFNLRKTKGKIHALQEGDLPTEAVANIAHRLGVSEDDVISMNRRMAGPDSSLNTLISEDGDGEWQDWLVDDREDQEAMLAHEEEFEQRHFMLEAAMSALNARERDIIVERRLSESPVTLDSLSRRYRISRERVRQIEVRALEKLQKSVRNQAIEYQLRA